MSLKSDVYVRIKKKQKNIRNPTTFKESSISKMAENIIGKYGMKMKCLEENGNKW